MSGRRRLPLSFGFALCTILLSATFFTIVGAQDNPCNMPGEEPDVIVGDIPSVQRFGTIDGITAFAIGTESCNIGTCWLNWIAGSADHPVIGQTMYRLKNDRFEQIGQSWVKHGFATFDDPLCSNDCIVADGAHLGVNCSDLYWAALNGNQSGLGPKFEVDPATGTHPEPGASFPPFGDVIFKRLQVHDGDLNPNLNPGALYFVEGQYVTADDAAAGNSNNNNSYREVTVSDAGGLFDVSVTAAPTEREKPAIQAWADANPAVVLTYADVPNDGRFIVGALVTPIGGGFWHYEYAVQNLTSDRAGLSFSVPVPPDAQVVAVGFHDVDYHSGEPFDGTDWSVSIESSPTRNDLVWRTEPYTVNSDANALRWGTLYNFRFDANISPNRGDVSIALFKPGAPAFIEARNILIPKLCNADGVCDPGESCTNCPADCTDQGGGSGTCCGDDVCDPGEDACSCAADCGPCLISCSFPSDCDDGLFCNGIEDCAGSFCTPGSNPCGGQLCDEGSDSCFACATDPQCDDADPCNGVETCTSGVCVPGSELCSDDGIYCNGPETCVFGACLSDPDPCPGLLCDEANDTCFVCNIDAHCEDGAFCNGVETCSNDTCFPGAGSPCAGDPCDEVFDVCQECVIDDDCSDGVTCNGTETCEGPGICVPPTEPACPGLCNESPAQCIGNVFPQARAGDPLFGLSATETARFDAGRLAFESVIVEPGGLGPVYNGSSCAGCHSAPIGGSGPSLVTRFGEDTGTAFDPLLSLGGSLMQSLAVSPACLETLPAQANVTAQRLTTSAMGAGLVEAIDDADISALAQNPPAGVSGVAHLAPVLEDSGNLRVGRFGWKSQRATVLSFSAEETRDQIGMTNRLLPAENAPNGDAGLLAACDLEPDPEDGPDAQGWDFIDRVTDFQRFLAAPPQTPRSGMNGELWFNLSGCSGCHVGAYTTPGSPALEDALRNKTLRPYSDFLLHDMGSSADFIEQGDALPQEVRTAPLWGIRMRDSLWHDGRISGGTLEDRILAAIALHDVPGSEAQSSAQSFASQPLVGRNAVITFLDSLGRAEFDHDDDNDVDADDYAEFLNCFTGPGGVYTADDPCAISDVDQDGDVDDDDRVLFVFVAADTPAGRVPDGDAVPGTALTLVFEANETLTLNWGVSCGAGDLDYDVYEGALGDFTSHTLVQCGTGGATTTGFFPGQGDTYYLVAPTNGFREGSYGTGQGAERPPGVQACLPQATGACP